MESGVWASSNYRTDVAGKYLMNTRLGILGFVGSDPTSAATLYEVVESRATSFGPDVILRSPSEGLAANSAVGFHGAQMISAEHPHWPIHDTWIRLAHRYRAWTDRYCGNCARTLDNVPAPRAVMQRVSPDGDTNSCTQKMSIDTGGYQFIDCDAWYVSVGGSGAETNTQLAATASVIHVEVCTNE